MPIKIIRAAPEVTEAINAFEQKYHQGFDTVRSLGVQYLQTAQPVQAAVAAISKELHRVLHEWGAALPGIKVPGAPRAPVLRDCLAFVNTFNDRDLHRDLNYLQSLPLSRLRIVNDRRRIANPQNGETIAAFDDALLAASRRLSRGLFEANTNVTYPMKALLLITGLMPAFDGQVRKGLKKSGLPGFSSTQYLMPDDANSAAARKITRLPFLLGECWNNHVGVLTTGIKGSQFPTLITRPGRFFDVLLFVQGRGTNPIRTLEYQGDSAWYDFD